VDGGDDPKWLAFYGLLHANSRLVDLVGSSMERETGLPASWFEVLARIKEEPIRMSELADDLTLSRGGATRLVARMEDAGLVVREIPPQDRRATFARVTAQGQEAFERALPVHLEAVERFFSRHITDTQAAAMRSAFANLLVGNGYECTPVTDEAALRADASHPS
jgi:DNA-binding MarR family transcriptional regulator